MLDLPPRTGRRMKKWEKIGWSVWFGFLIGIIIYDFTH